MTITPEQRHEIEQDGAVRIEDPETHAAYVILKAEVFERIKPLLESGHDDLPEGNRRSHARTPLNTTERAAEPDDSMNGKQDPDCLVRRLDDPHRSHAERRQLVIEAEVEVFGPAESLRLSALLHDSSGLIATVTIPSTSSRWARPSASWSPFSSPARPWSMQQSYSTRVRGPRCRSTSNSRWRRWWFGS